MSFERKIHVEKFAMASPCSKVVVCGLRFAVCGLRFPQRGLEHETTNPRTNLPAILMRAVGEVT